MQDLDQSKSKSNLGRVEDQLCCTPPWELRNIFCLVDAESWNFSSWNPQDVIGELMLFSENHCLWFIVAIGCSLLLQLQASSAPPPPPRPPPDRLTRLPASPIPWVLPPRQSASELRSLAEVPPPPTTPQRGDGLGGRKPFRTDNRHFVCLSPHCASECACRDPVFLQPWGLVKEGRGGGAATGGWPFQQLSLGECNLSQSVLLSYSLLPNTWDALLLLYYRANFWPTHTHIHYSMFTLIVTLKASCRRLQEAAGGCGKLPARQNTERRSWNILQDHRVLAWWSTFLCFTHQVWHRGLRANPASSRPGLFLWWKYASQGFINTCEKWATRWSKAASRQPRPVGVELWKGDEREVEWAARKVGRVTSNWCNVIYIAGALMLFFPSSCWLLYTHSWLKAWGDDVRPRRQRRWKDSKRSMTENEDN